LSRALQIARRGVDVGAKLSQEASDKVRVRLRPHSDRDVEGLCYKVDIARRQIELESNRRIGPRKFRDQGREVGRRKIDGQRDTQASRRLRSEVTDGLMGKARLLDNPLTTVEIELTRFGEFNLARRA